MSVHNAFSFVQLMRFLYSFLMFQMEIASGSIEPIFALPCQASADSILDYGQYVILSTGNFLCSAPTVNSTMDFSVKPIQEGVVDSPPNSKLCVPISCSPSPLRSMHHRASSMSLDSSNKGTQRKLMERNLSRSLPQRGLRMQRNVHFHFLLQPLRLRQQGSGYYHRSRADIRGRNRVIHSLRLPQLQAMTLGVISHWKCKSNNNCVNTWGRFIREDTVVDQGS